MMVDSQSTKQRKRIVLHDHDEEEEEKVNREAEIVDPKIAKQTSKDLRRMHEKYSIERYRNLL